PSYRFPLKRSLSHRFDGSFNFLLCHSLNGFFRRAFCHCTLVPIELSVGCEVQIRVVHKPLNSFQRQPFLASFMNESQYGVVVSPVLARLLWVMRCIVSDVGSACALPQV